jgi:Fe-S-cluster-containing dehydrogenase component
MNSPWPYECPYGHRQVRRQGDGFKCRTCADHRKNGEQPGVYERKEIRELGQ